MMFDEINWKMKNKKNIVTLGVLFVVVEVVAVFVFVVFDVKLRAFKN